MHSLAIAAAWLWSAAAVAPPTPTPVPEPKTSAEFAQRGNAAYRAGDMAAFLRDYREAARLRPGDTRILYNLACAQSRNGESGAAVATLRELAARRVAADLAGDSDFEAIRADAGFREIVARMEALREERITSGAAPAFTIPEKELAPEGVAFDPVTKAFFVASVRKGKIVRIGPDGKITDFVPAGRDGMKSALGIGVDAKRRTLWVAHEAIPLMNGVKEGDPADSALFAFDLDTGRLRRRYAPPPSPTPPRFDDLAVAPDGRVFVNDGGSPRIFELPPEGGELRVWLQSDAMGGTQGLAATRDGRALYASDYRGLYRIDRATRRVTPLPVPDDAALSGVDGLLSFEGALIAIQNGIEPHRVVRLDLAPDGVHITRVRILEMNHPAFDEPTLGTIVDGTLYFTANNQGHRYYDTKHPYRPEDLRDAVILKVSLKPRV
jgi:sugar lactone lactonase YvrE